MSADMHLTVAVTTATIALLQTAGAATTSGINREIPYSGYSDYEVAEVMHALGKAHVVVAAATDVWVPGARFPHFESPS